MANVKQLEILMQGVEQWNKWREDNAYIRIDLSWTDLSQANLNGADLTGANLNGTDLTGANLINTNLTGADLTGANLNGTDLTGANLINSNLTGADLTGANFIGANLIGANLIGVDLTGANLSNANVIDLDSEIEVDFSDGEGDHAMTAVDYSAMDDGAADGAMDDDGAADDSAEDVIWEEFSDHGGYVLGEAMSTSEPPDAKQEWKKVLQEELDRLPVGKIVFNPPETMKVAIKERVEARISGDLEADLISSLRGRGIPKIEELKIYELMAVRLTGYDFDIVPLNQEEQIIDTKNFTEWAWDVTPQKSGKKSLHLHCTLRIRLHDDALEKNKDHPVLDREIVVQVNRAYSIKSFISKNWKWIATALLLPLIGWAIKTYIIPKL